MRETYYGVPAELRKDPRCPADIRIFEEYVFAGMPLMHRWDFREYRGHNLEKASFFRPVSRIRFYRYERPAPDAELEKVYDPVELCFCGGPFRYQEANAFAKDFEHDLIQARIRLLSPGY